MYDGQFFIPVARVSKIMDGMFLGTQEASQVLCSDSFADFASLCACVWCVRVRVRVVCVCVCVRVRVRVRVCVRVVS